MASTLKRRVGALIPYPLIALGRRVVHFGPHRCQVCDTHLRHKLDSGYGYPVLEELQVIGGMRRRGDRCPVCHSTARERLIWFYLTRHFFPRTSSPEMRIAHFAPEKGLSLQLRSRFGSGYAAYDIEPARYRQLPAVNFQNLEKLDLADASVDLLLCNHVMEHVFDLEASLREIARVLSDDGLAIMQVPLSLKLTAMRDGGQDKTPQQRIAMFGQDDHVRLFTPDSYRDALRQAGLSVESYDPFANEADEATGWELDPFEPLFLIRRDAASPS